jgi:hypothetical protein
MPTALRASLFALVALLVQGCVTDEQRRAAIIDVNEDFRQRYEQILAKKGTRFFRVRREQAFAALASTFRELGMQESDQSPDIGYLNVYAPAPKPLTKEEWEEAAKIELPRLRELVGKHIGLLAHFINFEPEGLDIVINTTALERRGGAEISLTMRMREVKPPKSGMPRRDYPPPTAVDKGLDKIWAEFERQLRAARAL